VSSEPGQALDAAHMQALAVAALRSAGFAAREERLLPALLDPDTQLLRGDGPDLGALWAILIDQGGFTPTLAGRVMLLAVIYLDSHLQVPLTIPQDMRMAIKMALPTVPDLEARMAGLLPAIEALRKDPPKLPETPKRR
jgi:hypothetical protein